MYFMGSILCQYFRTSCYFPNQIVHAGFIQRVSQQCCSGLAWNEMKFFNQSINYINLDQPAVMEADQHLYTLVTKTPIKWNSGGGGGAMLTEKSVSGDWLDGCDCITALTKSVSQLVAKLNPF